MKIVLACGGTGGHIFPAIGLYDSLRRYNHAVLFIGVFKKMEDAMRRRGIEYKAIHAQGLTWHSPVAFFKAAVSMGRALFESYQFFKHDRPDAVVGFGGYAAFAPVLSAFALRVPILIHEQNVLPGRANRFLSLIADKIAVTFEESRTYFPKEKVIHTGCPLHWKASSKSREELLRKYGLRSDCPLALVLGGSQGSQAVNRVFLEAAKLVKTQKDIQVFHLTGSSDQEASSEAYRRLGIAHYVTGFHDEMEEAYALADIVIARAGAVTVNEIAASGSSAILIPYPYAGGHQKENAKMLEKYGFAAVIEEKDLNPETLTAEILRRLKEGPKSEAKKNICGPNFNQDASERLTQAIFQLADET